MFCICHSVVVLYLQYQKSYCKIHLDYSSRQHSHYSKVSRNHCSCAESVIKTKTSSKAHLVLLCCVQVITFVVTLDLDVAALKNIDLIVAHTLYKGNKRPPKCPNTVHVNTYFVAWHFFNSDTLASMLTVLFCAIKFYKTNFASTIN